MFVFSGLSHFYFKLLTNRLRHPAMLFVAVTIYLSLNHVILLNAGAINLNLNSVEDPLAGGEACGASGIFTTSCNCPGGHCPSTELLGWNVSEKSGYVLDAPIPEVMKSRKRSRRAATNHAFRVWPNGQIPYQISNAYSKSAKHLIRKAMNHWSNQTCVQFVKRTTQVDYLHIYRGTGCCSYVGRRGGKQYLSLGTGCLRFGIITHELGHAVGFWHEQNRPDRSIYIDVIYDNVDSSKYLNFDPRSLKEVNTFDQVYDYKSIMHYGTRFFSKNDGKTIQTKKARGSTGNPADNEIGKSYYKFDGPVLSTQDVLETNLLYKCTKITECGGTLFASKGSFTSMNYPTQYPLATKRDCSWIITTTQESTRDGKHASLTLMFEKFNVGKSKSRNGVCEDDYIEVREGKGFLSPYIVRYCGNISPSPITTMSGSLYVRFHVSGKNVNSPSNAVDTFTGFQADFKTDVCSHHIKTFPTKIQSPQFPFAYSKGKDCLWVIEASKGMQVELEFLFFSLRELDAKEGCLDYIEIHEGDGNTERFIGRYCGSNNPKKITSKLNKVKIHFHANKRDRLGWYMGFQAGVRQKDVDECALGIHECTQACSNYPGGYFCGCYEGYNTVYQRDSRKAECVDKDECGIKNGGCSHDCVNTDGSFVCACPTGYTLSVNKTTCVDINECMFQKQPCSHFCTNTIGGYECSCNDGYLLQSDDKTCSSLPGCLSDHTTAVGKIDSPVIPITYRHDVRCSWKINVPKHLKLSLSINLPWSDDDGECLSYLLIHNNRYQKKHRLNTRRICSQADLNEHINMEKNTAIIDYFGKNPFPPKFVINYHSISSVKHHCGQVFNASHGRFRTPGYPYQYPESQNCVWTIHSQKRKQIKLRFVSFGIEYHEQCEFDYIDVEEHFYNISAVKKIGRFCGNKAPPKMIIDGRTSYFQLKFHSDETMNEKGFKAVFKELNID